MRGDPTWLASRNAIRNASRAAARAADEAAGRRPRRTYDGMGGKRSKQKYSEQRSRNRLLAKLRKMRRPFVQGKRRLWGKGPAPLYYIQQQGDTHTETPFAPCSSPSSMAVCCSPAPSTAPAGGSRDSSSTSPWEPLDTPVLDMLAQHLNESENKLCEPNAKREFRILAQCAGIACT